MGVSSHERDLEAVREGLTRWLRARRPEAADLRVEPLTRPSEGLSSETLFVDVAWTERGVERRETLVARLPPGGAGLFPDYDLRTQARIQELLGPAGIPVAVPIALEEDDAWIGAPFLLMPRVPGRIPTVTPPFLLRGWLHDAAPEDQACVYRGFLDVLADIHRLDWQSFGLGFAARAEGVGLLPELHWWEEFLGWSTEGAPPRDLADAMAWCRENLPGREPPPSLLWGDAQIYNVVFDEAFRPAAVLDWEMASIGPAELDLGWFLALHEMGAASMGNLPGFLDREATIARYGRRLGRQILDLTWFEVFALVRAETCLTRLKRLLAEQGIHDSRLQPGSSPAIHRIAQLIDEGAPGMVQR